MMNAGMALYVGGKADSYTEGIRTAAEMIDSGKATKQLDEFVRLTNLEI